MDLMAVIEPLMTSPALYPTVAGFAAADVLFPVIPSEGAMIAAGVFAASVGAPNLALVMAVAAAGAFVGDHVAYGVGRSMLGPRLIRRSRRLEKAVGAIARQLDKRGGIVVGVGLSLAITAAVELVRHRRGGNARPGKAVAGREYCVTARPAGRSG